jgi:hypothetical protein
MCAGGQKGETYTILVFHKTLIVTANSNEEEQAVNILKAMDPLLALRALSSNIKHAVCQVPQVKDRLCDTRCAQARAQHILVCRHIIARKEAVDIFKKAV